MIARKKVLCTLCGKEVKTLEEMQEHYKEHPEIKVIDGVNELEAIEELQKNEEGGDD